jgi:deoxyribonucleoside regulator
MDQRLERLAEVARAYYLENRTQAEIARSLGTSRSQISRYLSEARDKGLVQIRIVAPDQASSNLGEAVRERFPQLKDVTIAPLYNKDNQTIRAIIGRYAANYISEAIRPGQVIALGCGRTLRAMVRSLPEQDIAEVTLVQAMGNIGHEAHEIDYNAITREAAEALGGRTYYVSAPAILGRGSGSARSFLEANPMVDHALSLARQADLFIVGLGSMESDLIYTRFGLITGEELADLSGRAVGDICGRFFDLHGRVQPSSFDDRVVGIQLDDLRRSFGVMGVAGGPDKAAPLLGAIRGGWIDILVTDEQTARSILALDEAYPGNDLRPAGGEAGPHVDRDRHS